MKKLFLLFTLVLYHGSLLFSQVAINADGSAPHESAGLDISYSDKGILIPRLNHDQRNAIVNPADGLILFCSDCGSAGNGALSIFQGGSWKVLDMACTVPVTPTVLDHQSSTNQIVWDWLESPLATGYKWSTTDNFSTAVNLGAVTTYTETGLECWSDYTRYIWSYNECGNSPVMILNQSTLELPLNTPPTEGTHTSNAIAITWKWNVVADATGYKWNTSNDYSTAINMGASTNYLETGLVCGTSYTRYLWAYNVCGKSDATTLVKSTSMNPPPAPEAATHEAYTNLIIWNWLPVDGATGYKWSTTNNYATALEMGTITSKMESGLSCNQEYNRYVWAYGDCGVSVTTTLVQSTALDPPENPGIGSHEPSPTQIIWHWFAVGDATGYKWNDENDYNTAEDMGTALFKTETGLNCNTDYLRYVWSYSACGQSAAVNMVQTSSLNPPPAPTALTHIPSPAQIIWNWNPVDGATGYKWNTSNDISTAYDSGPLTTYTQSGLLCNTPYVCYVWTYNNCGTSTPVSFTQTTSLNPPAAPAAGSHTAAPAQIIWRWNVVADATGYKWNTTNSYSTAMDMGTAISKTESGLNCNTGYTRFVWAYSNCGTSTAVSLSSTTTILTPAAPATGSHVASNTQVIWNWNAVAGVTGYKWNTTNDYATAINMATATTYTENSLTCGTNYTRYVWSYNNCANSVSVALVKTTTTNPPTVPIAATHTASGNQIIWNWNLVSGATGYKWSATNDFATATDVGNVTSKTENGLACATGYTRYVWAYNGCANSTSASLNATTTATPPASPTSSDHTAMSSQIIWNWNPVADAAGYKWNSVAIYSSATDVGNSTSYTEAGLACSTTYTRFAWAYNSCGVSTPVPLTQTTINDPPPSPTEGAHESNVIQIIWHWNTVTGVTGYKWSTTNNYSTAIDMGTATSHTETGLVCGTNYTRYVWAYHSCGTSTTTTLMFSTEACFVCGTSFSVSHVAGNVAPVSKTTTYGTVTGIPGATSKCWITSNLGSDHQATSVSDNTEASAGWYWQFNRTQGYKHDGTARTPNTTWTSVISENNDWIAANDPCSIELGIGWRMPTSAEWTAVDDGGDWVNWNGPWNSNLKIHAAGKLSTTDGALSLRGMHGLYWSTTQNIAYNYGQALFLYSSSSTVGQQNKAYGMTIRCLKD